MCVCVCGRGWSAGGCLDVKARAEINPDILSYNILHHPKDVTLPLLLAVAPPPDPTHTNLKPSSVSPGDSVFSTISLL